jgi:hypothetical protein
MNVQILHKSLKGLFLPLFICCLIFGNDVYSQNNTILTADFEGPSIGLGWDGLENCCSYSMTTSTLFKRTGNRSLRVELRKTDAEIAGNKRSEIVDNSYPIPHETNRRWWAFSNYLPADFGRDSVHEILAQWHYRATNSDLSTSPPLSLQIYKGDWIVELRYDSVDINIDNGQNIKLVSFNLGPWQKGVWNDWVFNYEYSPNNDGYLKVYKDGKLLIDYKGKSFYKGSYDPYFKIGLYRWVWGSSWPSELEQSVYNTRVYYFDNVKIGNKNSILQDFLIPNPVPSNIPPVATAGHKQTLPVPYYTATLKGSESMDPDGTIVSYQWNLESGPNIPSMPVTNIADLKVTKMIQGNYLYRITVTDNLGAKSYSTAEISIVGLSAINKLPVVELGPTRMVTLPANSITLSSTGTIDPDGTIVSYSWLQESGPFKAMMENTNTATTNISGLQKGSYFFKLVVTDNKGGFSTGYVQVYVDGAVSMPNIAPVASAGTKQTLTFPASSAVLDASGSFDADGSIRSYNWTQISGPSVASFTSAITANPTVSKLQVGSYVFSILVTDNRDATDTANVLVQVNPAPPGVNIAPVSNAGPNQSFPYFYSTFSLKGNLSYDPDGKIVSYKWTQDSGPSTIFATPDSANTIVRNVTVSGVYVYRLTVLDSLGSMSSSTMTINLLPAVDGVSGKPLPNIAPVSNAGTDVSFPLLWNTISLNGNKSTDSDGVIVAYKWMQESGPRLLLTTPDSVFTLARDPKVGLYVFRLAVTDNKGMTASSAITINILPPADTSSSVVQPPPVIPLPANKQPIANAGQGQTFTLFYNTITLNGSLSSDSDGVITSYRWTQESGPVLPMSYPDSVINVIRNIVTGTYIYRLVITDNRGAQDTARVTINILPLVSNARLSGNNSSIANSADRVELELTTHSYWKWGEKTIVTYPNPVRGELVIEMNNPDRNRVQVQLYDMQGALLHQEGFEKPANIVTHKMSLIYLPVGAYLIRVSQGNKSLLSRRISKVD